MIANINRSEFTRIPFWKNNPENILDVATGTADFAISAAKKTTAKIIGIDISQNMLEIGKNKKFEGYSILITKITERKDKLRRTFNSI